MGFILLPALSESRMLKYISKYYYIIFCRYLSDSPATKKVECVFVLMFRSVVFTLIHCRTGRS